jgi:hypothetical protein
MPPKTNADTLAEMAKKIAELEKANAELKAKSNATIRLKVSEKGGLSVYGMGRFPITLYRSQWETLLADAQVAEIKSFIVDHATEFSAKVAKVVQGAGATLGTVGHGDKGDSKTNAVGDQGTAPKSGLPFDLATGKTIGPSGNSF